MLACCGEILTLETVAAAAILRDKLPNLKVRVVHVVDFMRLEPAKAHSHGLPDAELDALFTDEQPVIFAYHGYPTLIHRLTCRRLNHANIHVRGYKEEGTTTTPFDTVMPNGVDRFHHVIDVIDRVPRLSDKAGRLRREMAERRLEAPIHTRENRDDPNEIRDWTWPASASTCASL